MPVDSAAARQKLERRVRYNKIARDVVQTLGSRDGPAWLREHQNTATRSIFNFELEWHTEKQRLTDQLEEHKP